jgi:acetylornithine/N-succinyldiaminopimelate aminotransferase
MLTPGTHGSTFGGNPLVTGVASSVLDVFENDLILDNVIKMSQYFESEFKSKIMSYSVVKELRIKGLMIGIGLDENTIDCSKLTQKALDDKLLINITGNSIRMLPPLIISKKEIDILIKKIIKLITI